MAGKWRLARFCGQLVVESGVEVRTFRGRRGPFATLVLSQGDLTLVIADPVVLEQLAHACWRAGDALGRMQPGPLQLDAGRLGQVSAEPAAARSVA